MNSHKSAGKYYLTTPLREEAKELQVSLLDSLIPYNYDFSKSHNAHRFCFNEEIHFNRAKFFSEKNAEKKGKLIVKGTF